MSVSYKNKSKDFIRKSAATFSTRSYAGRSRVIGRAHIQGEEWYGWQMVEEELKRDGIELKSSGGILGRADQIMSASKGRFAAFPLHLWKRRNIYRRLQWLRGELTRLMTNEPPFNGTPQERQAAIDKRKEQINRYSDALEDLKPLHVEIERQRRVYVQFKRRRRKAKEKRKNEIKAALAASKAALDRSRVALRPHTTEAHTSQETIRPVS